MNVGVDDQPVFSNSVLMLEAEIAGVGLIYLMEGQIQPHVETGELIEVELSSRVASHLARRATSSASRMWTRKALIVCSRVASGPSPAASPLRLSNWPMSPRNAI